MSVGFDRNIEVAVLIAAVVAVFNLGAHKLPPADPVRTAEGARARKRANDRRNYEPAGEAKPHGSFVAWGGFACALISLIGFRSFPGMRLLWVVLLAVAIASVPLSTVIALTGNRMRSKRR